MFLVILRTSISILDSLQQLHTSKVGNRCNYLSKRELKKKFRHHFRTVRFIESEAAKSSMVSPAFLFWQW